MTRITDDLEKRPAFEAARAMALVERARRAAESNASLRSADQRLLWLFRDGSPRTLRDVAEALGLEQSTVNRQVNAALDSGLLRRYREPGQSAHLVEATEEGLSRFAGDIHLGLGLLDAALAAVPETERDTFLRHLSGFADAYDTAAHRPVRSSR